LLASPRADLAAACGALIAARLARVPVITAGTAMHTLTGLLDAHHISNSAHCLSADTLPGARQPDDHPINAALALAQIKYLANLPV
jgi:hypothetical protein